MAPRRLTAVSALLLSLGISGGVVLTAVPFIGQVASASVAARDPGDVIPPCDAGESCEPTEVVTTVTITSTLPTPTPTPTDPVTTVTTTVTPKATKTTKAPDPTTDKPTTQAPPVQPPPVVPSADVSVPQTSAEVSEPAPTFSFPAVQETPSQTSTGPSAEPSTAVSDSEELVVRNAAPEYDQTQLSRKLGIPALVLVLLALFAVLIFEGRLRRLAHAAAVRRAGPQGPVGRHRGEPVPEPYGYPAGPGFAGPVPAYAPIISFVPVQTYPGGPAQYAPVYQQPFPQDPSMYGPPTDYPAYAQPGYPQPEQTYPEHAEPEYTQPEYVQPEYVESQDQPPGEFNAFQPREFQVAGDDPLPPDVMSGQTQYRDLFEPLVPPDQPPLGDIPPGGDAPYDDPHHPGHGAALASSAQEAGDAEPWKFDDAARAEDGTMILPLSEDRDRREF